MSKLLDDIKRAAEARQKLVQNQRPDQTQFGFDEEKPDNPAVRRPAEAESTRRFLAWRQAERAARKFSMREAARAWLTRWLPAALAFGTAIVIGIGIGSLLTTRSEEAAVPTAEPAFQMQPGPPLHLRLETDLERIGRNASVTTSERSAE